jgi:hypothetical protein
MLSLLQIPVRMSSFLPMGEKAPFSNRSSRIKQFYKKLKREENLDIFSLLEICFIWSPNMHSPRQSKVFLINS